MTQEELLIRLTNNLTTHHLATPTDRILLAVSGGADSVCMLDLFVKAGYNVAIAHVNFHLRGDDSNRDELFVRGLAKKYNVEIFVKSFDTKSYAEDKHISIEMAARDLRYAEFEQIMNKNGYAVTAVAHHIDDAVETFMLNLLRGTGISGLTGMHEKNGRIIRPMLGFTRKEIEQYIKDNGLEYVTDVTNFETEFSRNKIRNCVIPYFEEINPSFRNSFADTFKYMQQVKDIYYEEIERQKDRMIVNEESDIKIDIEKLLQYPHREAFMFEVLRTYGFNKQQVAQIATALTSGSGKLFISNTHRLVKDRKYLIINQLDNFKSTSPLLIPLNQLVEKYLIWGDCRFEFDIIDYTADINLKCGNQTAFFDLDKLVFPLEIRHWHSGDTIVPFGQKQPKKLSDIFINQKLTLADKERVPILCSGGNIIWAVGIRASDYCKVTPNTKRILRIFKVL
ncbi:MAG: tRNA lysidine(34) synthetase TilS [Bacteroidales bacterium]|nr:tRNA lysidine(34) synthetase TilS [Bacteroidales bacterium]